MVLHAHDGVDSLPAERQEEVANRYMALFVRMLNATARLPLRTPEQVELRTRLLRDLVEFCTSSRKAQRNWRRQLMASGSVLTLVRDVDSKGLPAEGPATGAAEPSTWKWFIQAAQSDIEPLRKMSVAAIGSLLACQRRWGKPPGNVGA